MGSFSLAFPRFPWISKNRRNTSLVLKPPWDVTGGRLKVDSHILFAASVNLSGM